jgi:hypothetical protein
MKPIMEFIAEPGRITVFWDLISSSLMDTYQYFDGTYYLHLHLKMEEEIDSMHSISL